MCSISQHANLNRKVQEHDSILYLAVRQPSSIAKTTESKVWRAFHLLDAALCGRLGRHPVHGKCFAGKHRLLCHLSGDPNDGDRCPGCFCSELLEDSVESL